MAVDSKLITTNLLAVFAELRRQTDSGKDFPPEMQSFADQVEQIREWIEDAREYGSSAFHMRRAPGDAVAVTIARFSSSL
jgi:hypothetical protein